MENCQKFVKSCEIICHKHILNSPLINANLGYTPRVGMGLINVQPIIFLSVNFHLNIWMKLKFVKTCKNEANKWSSEEKWALNIYSMYFCWSMFI